MNSFFVKTMFVNDSEIEFSFEQVVYSNVDLWYHIRYTYNTLVTEFRMYRDEEGQWKIAAQVLPIWIHEQELNFNDAIEDNLMN